MNKDLEYIVYMKLTQTEMSEITNALGYVTGLLFYFSIHDARPEIEEAIEKVKRINDLVASSFLKWSIDCATMNNGWMINERN